MKHKHCDLIKAWADGVEIEQRYNTVNWQAIGQFPSWSNTIEYRIKPKTIKYRCYLNTCGEIEVIRHEEDPLIWFAKWLSDWQEVEV